MRTKIVHYFGAGALSLSISVRANSLRCLISATIGEKDLVETVS
jgi:hypothetical protein